MAPHRQSKKNGASKMTSGMSSETFVFGFTPREVSEVRPQVAERMIARSQGGYGLDVQVRHYCNLVLYEGIWDEVWALSNCAPILDEFHRRAVEAGKTDQQIKEGQAWAEKNMTNGIIYKRRGAVSSTVRLPKKCGDCNAEDHKHAPISHHDHYDDDGDHPNCNARQSRPKRNPKAPKRFSP